MQNMIESMQLSLKDIYVFRYVLPIPPKFLFNSMAYSIESNAT